MNAQISEAKSKPEVDPVKEVKWGVSEEEVALELGRQAFTIVKQAKYIAALEAALRKQAE